MEIQIAPMEKSRNKWLFFLKKKTGNEGQYTYLRVPNLEETVKPEEEYRDKSSNSGFSFI